MKTFAFLAMLLAVSAPSHAAIKSCEDLKTEIEAKLKDHKVETYTLEVVDADKAGSGKVVGSCEGGKKKIVYAKK
jgi:hypothetical protein